MGNRKEFRAAIKRYHADVCKHADCAKRVWEILVNDDEKSWALADNWCLAHDYPSSHCHDFFKEVERVATDIDYVCEIIEDISRAPIADDGNVTVYSLKDNVFVLSKLRVFGTLRCDDCSFDDAIDYASENAATPDCVKMPCRVVQAMVDALIRDLQNDIAVI